MSQAGRNQAGNAAIPTALPAVGDAPADSQGFSSSHGWETVDVGSMLAWLPVAVRQLTGASLESQHGARTHLIVWLNPTVSSAKPVDQPDVYNCFLLYPSYN